jgi:Spy/CpxP family protein refolding chaperone
MRTSQLVTALSLAFALAGGAAAEDSPATLAQPQSPHTVAPAQAAPAKEQPPHLDNRGRKLAQMLDLTEAQQAQVAKILARQHEEIRKLWSEQKVPPDYRVSAMRAINDRARDQIRAILNDEQKNKYPAARPLQ